MVEAFLDFAGSLSFNVALRSLPRLSKAFRRGVRSKAFASALRLKDNKF
jgi:hypothetical protein